jgi:predicted ATPase
MLALLALLAEAYRENGQSEEGLRVIAEALDHVAQTGTVYYEAELHRLDGELQLQLDTPDEQRAETSFRRALGIARQQQAKSWELRACDEPSPSCEPNRAGGPKRANC